MSDERKTDPAPAPESTRRYNEVPGFHDDTGSMVLAHLLDEKLDPLLELVRQALNELMFIKTTVDEMRGTISAIDNRSRNNENRLNELESRVDEIRKELAELRRDG